jgi:hypothetical protein
LFNQDIATSKRNTMTITVFGATGRMQHYLITEALERGLNVVGYARNPSKMRIQHQRLTIVEGDLDNISAIEQAVNNADAVIETIGGVSKGTQNIITALKKTGVKRLIVVSTANVSDSKDLPDFKFTIFLAFTRMMLRLIGLFNSQIFNAVREVRKAAALVRASELDWTLVRVTILNNKPKSNNVKSGYLGQGIIGLSITRADMAGFILQQVTDRTYIQETPAISN